MSGDRPPDHPDKRIYDAYIAGRESAALAAAVRAGLFDALDSGPATASELARRLDLRERPVLLLCRTLHAMGLLARDGERFNLAPDARAHLVRGKPAWLGGLIDLEVENFLTPERVLEALRTDRASVYGGEDPWRRHAADPGRAAAFTRAMHSISALPADGLARAVDARGVRRVLDVGGGSGALAIALVAAWPELRCTIWDLETVCDVAREYVAGAGVADRIQLLSGDFWGDPVPAGHDAVLLSQILHDYAPERGAALLARLHDALPDAGRLWIHEKLIAEDGSGPLANALVDLDMLVWTDGQQYSEAQLRELLAAAGFRDIERRAGAGYWSLVSARR